MRKVTKSRTVIVLEEIEFLFKKVIGPIFGVILSVLTKVSKSKES